MVFNQSLRSKFRYLLLCLLLCFPSVTTLGQKSVPPAPRPIFGKIIAPQPADTQPFHEIMIPDWLEDMTRLTYCFSVMSGPMRDRATMAGSQMSEMGFVNPFYVNYSSAFLTKRDPGLATDYIDKEIADYKRRHVRILAVVPPGLQGEV